MMTWTQDIMSRLNCSEEEAEEIWDETFALASSRRDNRIEVALQQILRKRSGKPHCQGNRK